MYAINRAWYTAGVPHCLTLTCAVCLCRHVMDEDVLPDGTHVKNGWRVMYAI